MQILDQNDLYAKPEKCLFEKPELLYLEMIIGYNKIQIEKEKLQGIVDWLISKIVKEVQAFLEFANFY